MAFLSSLAARLLQLAPYFVVGCFVEAAYFHKRRNPSRALNLTATVIFWAFNSAAAASFMAYMTVVAQRLPWSGVIRLHPQTLIGTLALATVWVIQRDFFYYWFHRWQHTSKWLWAEHEVHHSDEEMNVTTTWRHHWLEYPLQSIFVVVPFTYLVGAEPSVIVAGYILSDLMVHFVHLDVPLGLGRWNWLIATPHLHRIHHSRESHHVDKNFAAFFPLWDVLFGTYCEPVPGQLPETGLHSNRSVRTVRDVVAWPFMRWSVMLRER